MSSRAAEASTKTRLVICLAALLWLCGGRGLASVTGTIQIVGNSGPAAFGPMSISINGMQETVSYDQTSTPASMASAFAAKFSKNHLSAGLCASAQGSLISFKLKVGTFGLPVVTGQNLPFQIVSSGFPSAPQTFSRLVTIGNIGNSDAYTITGITIAGSAAADFTIVGSTCPFGTQLTRGIHCTVTIRFTPSAAGVRTANLEITTTHNATAASVAVPLSGKS